MLFDKENMFSEDQAITATAASTNVIQVNLGTIAGDLGKNKPPLPISIVVTEAFATLTSLNIALQTDDNASFSSATTLWDKDITLAGGGLALGQTHDIYPPVGCEEYLRLNFTVTGSDATAGKINAGFVFDTFTNQ